MSGYNPDPPGGGISSASVAFSGVPGLHLIYTNLLLLETKIYSTNNCNLTNENNLQCDSYAHNFIDIQSVKDLANIIL